MCVSKQKALIWYDDRTSVAQLVVVESKQHKQWRFALLLSLSHRLFLPADGPGDEHTTSSRRFLFVSFGVGQEHFFALLIIMNNVNLRITTSKDTFRQVVGDFPSMWGGKHSKHR